MGAILQFIYPLARPLTALYFYLWDLVFTIINFFIPRRYLPPCDDEVLNLAAVDAAEMIRKGQLTSKTLVEGYIARIKAINPIINAMVEDNFENALKEAAQADAYLKGLDKNSDEFRKLSSSKPLLGVPFSAKDCYAAKDLHHTTGIVARKDIIAETDAQAIANMKEAGAILLGITNVPEAALWVESSNHIYGRTANAYDSRRSCGGSSGGEGALIGAAGSVIGIGSDIGGSIRIPSMWNGIFGLKPSEDAVCLDGHYPYFTKGYRTKMGVSGPMCRYAKDMSLFFELLVGKSLAESRFKLNQPIQMRKLRYFYMEGLNSFMIEPVQAVMKECLQKTVKYFEKKYDSCVYRVDFPRLHHALEIYMTSLGDGRFDEASFSDMLTQKSGSNVSVIAESCKNLFGKSDHTFPTMIMLALDKSPKMDHEMQKLIESSREALRRELVELLKDDGILIFPAWPSLPPFHQKPVGSMWSFMYTGIWNALCLPAVVCPMGLTPDGLPLSVQMIAGPDQDRLLIAAAQDMEEGFGGWRPPLTV